MQGSLRVRLVLEDAREAADRLSDRMAAGGNWRVDWVATVTLLRAVGNVLCNIDRKADDRAKAAIDAAWKQWKPDPLFKDFIKGERDLVLKEYELGTRAPAYLELEDGGRILLEDGTGAILLEQPNLGPIHDALRWWEEGLAALEAEIAQPVD